MAVWCQARSGPLPGRASCLRAPRVAWVFGSMTTGKFTPGAEGPLQSRALLLVPATTLLGPYVAPPPGYFSTTALLS